VSDWAEDLRAREQEALRKERLEASANASYDPSIARRVFAAAAKTNLPQQLVAEDLDNIESKLKNNTFDYEQYTDQVNGAPVFNKFAAENPYNYAVLESSRRNLTRLERTLEPMFQGWDSGWGMIEIAEIRDRQLKGDRREGDEQRLKELRTLTSGSGDYYGVDSWYMKALVMTAQQGAIQGWITKESLDEMAMGMVAGAAWGAGAGVPGGPIGSTVGAGAGALKGMGVGLVAGRTEAAYRLERGLAYDEYSELLGETDEMRMIAEGVGVANAALESVGLGALTKRIPGFSAIQRNATDRVIGQLFTMPTWRQGLARATLQYGEGMATEIVTEILQETTLMVGREYLKSQEREAGNLDPNMMPMTEQEFWGQVREIAAQTMYGTMLIGGAGPIMQMRSDARAANQAKAQQQYLETLGEAVQDEKLREEAPEAWQALLERLGRDGPVEAFRIRRDKFRSYWQGKEIDPDEAAAELGLNDEQINGDPEDIVVPFQKFIDKIAPTEHFQALLPDIRVNEDHMTQRDAEAWIAGREDTIARVEKQLSEKYGVEVKSEIVEDLKQELIASGYQPKAADIQSRLHAAIMTNYAMKVGMDPMELHKLRLKGVRRQVPVSMQPAQTDMGLDPLLDALRNGNYPKQKDIFGESLIEMIRSSGKIQDEGGELTARDFQKEFHGVMSPKGLTFDAAAEIAFERGYITDYDQTQLLAAIDRELAGEPVYSRTAGVNEELNDLRMRMEEAEQFLESEGIDLATMSNQEVRAALEAIQTFEQSDLEAYTRLLGLAMEKDPTLLTQVYRKMPRIREQQDFSSVTFTDRFVDEEGKGLTVEINAQDAFDKAVFERNVLKKLLDCVDG
jgi:hypothetical protein